MFNTLFRGLLIVVVEPKKELHKDKLPLHKDKLPLHKDKLPLL